MKKIFVTVGNDLHSFHRLIEEVDGLSQKTDQRFVIQYGYSSYVPRHVKQKDKFLSRDDFYDQFMSADIVVSHAGIGTIIDAIQSQKKLVIVPRQKKFDEHFNDHQLEIAKEVEGKYVNLAVIYDISQLEAGIGGLLNKDVQFPDPPKIASLGLVKEIKDFIKNEIQK